MSQQDLEQAVLEKVKTFGIPLDGRDIKVSFTTTRKPAGVSAEVEISAQGEKLAQPTPREVPNGDTTLDAASPEVAATQQHAENEHVNDEQDVELTQTPETPGFESEPSKNLFE